MTNSLFQHLFTGWHPMRWIALGFALFLGYNWIVNSAPVSGILSLFFLYQAVTNTGCLAGRCAVPVQDSHHDNIEDVEYEEIKHS
jgi:hypothetical protein